MALSFTWVNLPIDILPQICEKLDNIVDRIRFGAVCHEWRKIHWRCRKSIPPQPPMLLLREFVDRDKTAVQTSIMFSPINKHGCCNIPLPLIHSDISYLCWKNGWLITLSGDKVELLNPFLSFNNVIQLPTLPKDVEVLRAVLSHSPTWTSNYVVFITYTSLSDDDNMHAHFAYVKSGEKSWNSIHVGMDMDDGIYYNDRFYAICHDVLVCCDITSSTQEPTVTTLASLPNISLPTNWNNDGDCLYVQLLESRGELLCIVTKYQLKQNKLVSKISRLISTYISDEEQRVHLPVGFQIFKYETKDNVWKERKRLKGGQAIFVGPMSSLSIDVSNFPNFNYMPNHIYFLHSGFDDIKVGVFNLEDASFKFIDCKHKGSPIWVQPTLNMSERVIFSDSGDKRMLLKVENKLDSPCVWDSLSRFFIILSNAFAVAIYYN